jgi:hypothetical protein
MEEASTKALTFGVSLFVTMLIVSLVIASFGKIKEVLILTKNTDASIHSQFENIYLVYDGKELNGMGLLNTIKKFENDDVVSYVDYPGRTNIINKNKNKREVENLKEVMDSGKKYKGRLYRYEDKYRVEVKEINGKTVISFVAK